MDSEHPVPVAAKPSRRRWWRRLLIGGVAAVAAFVGMVALWLFVPALAPVRGPFLAFGLRSLDAALPGAFTFESARWPRSGRVELQGVRWIDGADTLALVEVATIDLDVVRLLRRDLLLHEVTVQSSWVDVVAIRERFPIDTTIAVGKRSGRAYLRDGPFPGVASFAIQALSIDAPRVRVERDSTFDRVVLLGSAQLMRGEPPAIDVRRLRLAHPANELQIDDSRIAIDLSGPGRIEAHGHGQLGARWPFALEGTTAKDGRFQIGLVRGAGPARPGVDGLFARGRLERDGWRARGVEVDDFTLVLDDLKASGTWRVRGDQHDGRIHADLRGRRWLESFVKIDGLPDTLAMTVDAHLHGALAALQAEAQARGWFQLSGVRYDRTSLATVGTLGERLRLRFAAASRMLDLSARGTGELLDAGERYELRLAPVRLDDAARAPDELRLVQFADVPSAAAAGAGAPVIVVRPVREPLNIRDLRFTGGFGEGHFHARLLDGAGTYTAAIHWPRAPEALIARSELTESQRETLRRAWRDPTRYRANLEGRIGPREPRLTADATFVLPGPAALAAFLPESARVADLGPIEGVGRYESVGSGWRITGDLERTPWIERMEFAAHESNGAMTLDRLDASLPGVTATLHTTVRGADVEGTLEARVRDPAFLARFAPALEPMQLRAAIQGRIRGRAKAPDVDLAFIAAAATPDARLPQVSGRALVRSGRLAEADLVAPRGATMYDLALDSLRLRYVDDRAPGGQETLPGRFTLVAGGPALAWTQSGHVRTKPSLTIATDSLRVVVEKQDLEARHPFELTLLDGGFQIDSLSLAGSMGTLAADGRATRDVSDLSLTASLTLPELPPSLRVPSGLAPSKLDVNLRPARGDSLELTLEAHGLQIASRKNLVAHVRVLGRPGQIVTSLRLDGDGPALLEATARMPGRFAIFAPQAPALDGPVEIDAKLTAFPLPPGLADPTRTPGYLDRGGLQRTLALDGDVHVRGTGAQPEGTLAGTITFPGWKALRKDRIDVEARLVSRAGVAASGGDGRAASRGAAAVFAVPAAGAPGITAKLSGTHDGKSALEGDLTLPLRISLAPASAAPIEGRELALKLDAPALPLQMLEPFATALRRLDGRADLHVTASGAPLNPTFDAKARIEGLDASTPERSRITGRGELTATGTLKSPVVRGRVQLDHGTIMLPAQQKLLHPTEGQALLWQGKGVIEAQPPDEIEHKTPPVNAEQTLGAPHGMASPGTATSDARAIAISVHRAADSLDAGSDALRALDLQIQIVAPGGTWVRGRGLDVELSGDVQLTQKDGLPTLVGEVEARGGGMELYGRRMDLERGQITFYGERKLNPALDVTLAKRTSEVDIVAHVTGTALNPRVEIESTPPLDQSEILSYLLFDRPLDNLDFAQNQRIEERAAGQAESYLAAQLTGRLSESLGLDLLSYERSRSDSTGNGSPTVTLGKYLTPQILLKVEQDFDDQRGFDVILEYWIRRGLRLSTHAQEARSGVGIDWTRDY